MRHVTPEHVQSIIINPFYAIQVAPELVETHTLAMSDEDWITGNSSLIEQMGVQQWLGSLLDVLQGNTSHDVVNPYHAINIDPTFSLEHPPMFPQEQWIQSNVMLLSQLGTEQWLRLLLDVLEGDFVTADDMGLASPPRADRTGFHSGKQRGKKRKKHKK